MPLIILLVGILIVFFLITYFAGIFLILLGIFIVGMLIHFIFKKLYPERYTHTNKQGYRVSDTDEFNHFTQNVSSLNNAKQTPVKKKPNYTLESVTKHLYIYVAVGIRATGNDPKKDQIIEVSAVRYAFGKPVEQFNGYIGYPFKISRNVQQLTGVSNRDLFPPHTFKTVIRQFDIFCHDDPLVGFKINDLIIPMMVNNGYSRRKNFKTVDLYYLYKNSFQLPNYELKTIREHMGMEDSYYKALDECYLDIKLYQYLINSNLLKFSTPSKKNAPSQEITPSDIKPLDINGQMNPLPGMPAPNTKDPKTGKYISSDVVWYAPRKQLNITKAPTILRDYNVVDIQTSSLKPGQGYILSIAAIKVHDGREVDIFHHLVNPVWGMPFDNDVVKNTGITEKMVQDAPYFEEIRPEFFDFVQHWPWVGYKINTNTVPVIHDAFNTASHFVTVDIYDFAHQLSDQGKLNLPNYNLETLRQHFKISKHNSKFIDRCRIVSQIYEKMIRVK